MEENLKQLLLKDLCARVPYHPKGHVVNARNGSTCDEWLTCATFPMFTNITNNCRLYLRPMSSMTDEEVKEYHNLCYEEEREEFKFGEWTERIYYHDTIDSIDYLNSIHIDYRGLIQMGLAIEVTEENNPYKNEVMKSYTDLQQSKKLADILPIESADMCWCLATKGNPKAMFNDGYNEYGDFELPCWSLSALLDVLPNNENISTNLSKGGYRISTLEYTNNWFVDYEDETNGLNNCVTSADNPIDACYEMIIKLKERDLL